MWSYLRMNLHDPADNAPEKQLTEKVIKENRIKTLTKFQQYFFPGRSDSSAINAALTFFVPSRQFNADNKSVLRTTGDCAACRPRLSRPEHSDDLICCCSELTPLCRQRCIQVRCFGLCPATDAASACP